MGVVYNQVIQIKGAPKALNQRHSTRLCRRVGKTRFLKQVGTNRPYHKTSRALLNTRGSLAKSQRKGNGTLNTH